MKKTSLGALVALNVVLIAALLLVLTMPGRAAQAQRRGRGDYLMISGEVTGRENQAGIYIFELKSYRMAAIMFDSRSNRVDYLATHNMTADIEGPSRTRR